MTNNNQFKKEKFIAMLHYIIEKCGSLPNVGKTVIWKILYFSEFDYYELYEKHISGEKFLKWVNGPAPEDFNECIKELKREKKIKEEQQDFHGHRQIKYGSIQESNIDALNGSEIKVINKTINKLSSMNATQISEYSHQDMPWKSAKKNGEIDYEMVFYRDKVMSVREYNDKDEN